MFKDVAVKDRHAPDVRGRGIQNDVDALVEGNIYRVGPYRIHQVLAVDGVRQKVDLMDVKRVNLVCPIDNTPVNVRIGCRGS